jgi:WXG100 family type VII secretion target
VDQIYGETGVLQQTATSTGTTADSITTQVNTLGQQVDTLVAQWDGSAREAFEIVFGDWAQGVISLVRRVSDLGEATGYSANTYLLADETSRTGMNNVASLGGAFNGALTV